MATPYSVFIYVYVYIMKVVSEEYMHDHMLSKLIYLCNCIYSPVNVLVLLCNPFLYDFRIRAEKVEGGAGIELVKGNLKQQCCHALRLLSRLEEDL